MRDIRHGLAFVMSTLLLSSTLVGCDSDSDSAPPVPPDGASNVVVKPPQPFDIVLGDKIGLISFVHLRVQAQCMKKAGFPQLLQVIGTKASNPVGFLTVGPRDFGPTSEEEATRLGFGQDAPAVPAQVISVDPSFELNLVQCGKEASEQLGGDVRALTDSYDDLGRQLADFRLVVDAEMPKDMPSRLLSCLERHGYKPDPAVFLDSPSYQNLGVKFGAIEDQGTPWQPKSDGAMTQVQPAVPARRYKPTAEESALAVVWVKCDKEIGRTETTLALVQKVQQRYVDRFQNQFAELNPKVEEMARKAAAVAG